MSKTISQLQAEITAAFPTNGIGAITAAIMRTVINNYIQETLTETAVRGGDEDFGGHAPINVGQANHPVPASYVGYSITLDTVAGCQAATIPASVQSITTRGFSVIGSGGWTYTRVATAPAVPGFSFRTVDRYLPNGTVDNTNGGYWLAVLGPDGYIDVRANGVLADGSLDGSTGTDNTAALQSAINTLYPLSFPPGVVRYTGQLTVASGWRWHGSSQGDDVPGLGKGTWLAFDGRSIAYPITSTAGVPIVQCFTENMSFFATAASLTSKIFKLYTPRNIYFYSVGFVNYATGLVDGVNGGGLILTVKNDPADKSWQMYFDNCFFQSYLPFTTAYPNQNIYQGYAYGLDTLANDVFLTSCHFNECSLIARTNGGVYATTTNWENVSSPPGGTDSGRAAVILTNSTGIPGMAGAFSSCTFNQASTACILDATFDSGVSECKVEWAACNFRRNWVAEVQAIGTAGRSSGGVISASSALTKDGDLSWPRVVQSNWYGFKLIGNVSPFPDSWLLNRGGLAKWAPRFSANTLDEIGLAATYVGTNTATTLATTNARTGTQRLQMASAAGAGNSTEIYSTDYLCWQSDIAGAGDFWVWFRFFIRAFAANTAGFFGLIGQVSAIGNNDPEGLSNMIGVGWKVGDTTLHVLGNDNAGPVYDSDLGSDFPLNTATIPYDVCIWGAANGAHQSVRVERIDTNLIAPQAILPTVQCPIGATLLAPHFWQGNRGAGGAVGFDFCGMEARTMSGNVFSGTV